MKNRIRQLRIENGINQSEFAKKMKVANSTMCNYENGTREPDYEIACKMADYFKVSLDFLLGRDNTTIDTQDRIIDKPNTITMIDKDSGKLTMTVSEDEMQALIALLEAFKKNKKN